MHIYAHTVQYGTYCTVHIHVHSIACWTGVSTVFVVNVEQYPTTCFTTMRHLTIFNMQCLMRAS